VFFGIGSSVESSNLPRNLSLIRGALPLSGRYTNRLRLGRQCLLPDGEWWLPQVEFHTAAGTFKQFLEKSRHF